MSPVIEKASTMCHRLESLDTTVARHTRTSPIDIEVNDRAVAGSGKGGANLQMCDEEWWLMAMSWDTVGFVCNAASPATKDVMLEWSQRLVRVCLFERGVEKPNV